MSDKLIRDEIMRSHRYMSLSNDTTKLLFLHLMLSSDTLSNAEATTTALSIIMGRTITETAAGALLAELADHDLVRLYESDGKRYVHIPRSRQRIRYLSGKHPRPPATIEDKEIKELIAKVGLKSDRENSAVDKFGTDDAGKKRDSQSINNLQAKVGPFAPEEKRSVVTEKQGTTQTAPVDKFPTGKWWASTDTIKAAGAMVGITAKSGESRDSLFHRVQTALRAKARNR